MMALYTDMVDMVRLGAARAGADPALDRAMRCVPRMEAFLTQSRDEPTSIAASFAGLAAAIGEG
jgi:flagellum-specific ATP synthase